MGQSHSRQQSQVPQSQQQHPSEQRAEGAASSAASPGITSPSTPNAYSQESNERQRTSSRPSVVSSTSLDRLRLSKRSSAIPGPDAASKFRQRLSRTFTPRSRSRSQRDSQLVGPDHPQEAKPPLGQEGDDAPVQVKDSPLEAPRKDIAAELTEESAHDQRQHKQEDIGEKAPAEDSIATAVPAPTASSASPSSLAGPSSNEPLASSPPDSSLAPSPPVHLPIPAQDSRRHSQLSVPNTLSSSPASDDSWRTAQNNSPQSAARSERSSVSSTPARRIMVQGTIAASPPPQQQQQQQQPPASPLAQPETDPEAAEERPRRSEESIFNPAAQAVLVSRLLSSASAATAASLLPGRINVGGRDIDPFPGLAQPAAPQQQQQQQEQPQDRPARPRLNSDELTLARAESRPQQRSRSNSAPDAISTERTSPASQASGQESTRGGGEEQRQGGLHMTRPSLSDAPMPSLQAPQGSFERFLADLQTDLSFAILRDHFSPNQQPTDEFSFFRSFRFEERGLDSDGQLREPVGGARDLGGSGQGDELELRAPADLEALAALPPSPSPPPEQSDGDHGVEREREGPRQEMVSPLLLVGVRSVPVQAPQQQPATGHEQQQQQSAEERLAFVNPFSFLGPQQPSSREDARSPLQDGPRRDSSGAEADPPHAEPALHSGGTADGETDERGATPANPEEHEPLLTPPPAADAQDVEQSGEEAPEADEDLPQPSPRPRRRRSPRAYVIWIAGGIYPASHPLLLFSDLDNARYEDLIRLAEVIGSVKRTTATQEEIDQAELPVVSVQELPALEESGDVLSNTVERCLICLEGYEDAPETPLRLLKCRHAFHKECVDKWLLSSKNSCPCCRVTAVAQKDDAPKPEASPDEPGAERPQQQFRREDPLDQIANALQRESLA